MPNKQVAVACFFQISLNRVCVSDLNVFQAFNPLHQEECELCHSHGVNNCRLSSVGLSTITVLCWETEER